MSAVLAQAAARAARLEAAPGTCFHCGAPRPADGRWQATIAEGAQAMCGPGCASAAQAIADAGGADYYATRTAFAPPAPQQVQQQPDASAHAAAADGEGTAGFIVEGVACTAGVRLIERYMKRLAGVREARFDPSTGYLGVHVDPDRCGPGAILRALQAIGYRARDCDAHGPEARPACNGNQLAGRLLAAGLSLLLVVPAAHLATYLAGGAADSSGALVAGWSVLLFVLPALLYAARPLLAGAWRDLRRGVAGMDIPAALGIAAAFLGSAVALADGGIGIGAAACTTLALFVFLLLASRWLELRVRARSGAPLYLGGRAGQERPALARRAGRVAAWLVTGTPLLAVLLLGAWWRADPGYAWQVASAVLLVSCPRALALATPVALAAASDRLLRCGVLAVRPHMLQTFDRVTHIVFDKTALTNGRPVLHRTLPVGSLDGAACLAIAAALEADDPHPLARAIRAAAGTLEQEPVQARGVRCLPGQGVEGWVGERYYRLGSAAWVGGLAGGAARATAPAGTTSVWLGNGDGWLARLDLADSLRPEAAEVVRRFRAAGKTVLLLSGDEQQAAQSVAAQLGIPEALGGKLPHEKREHVRRLRLGGAVVAMVAMVGEGDGGSDRRGDAALLRAADVSFAMGRQADTGPAGADCVLLGAGLLALADSADTARRTQRAIRQNLAWAVVYHALALPAAALGLLAPWMVASGAAAASALVVLNALRLGRA